MARARIGIVGTGWWATQFHIPGLLSYEDAEVVALADPNAERLATASRVFGIERTHPSHRELLEAGGVDRGVLATPHAHPHPGARDPARPGGPVLGEEPV